MKAKIKEHQDLNKDLHTGIVQNANKQAFLQFLSNREKALSNTKTINDLQDKVNALSLLVQTLLDKGDK